MSIQDFIIIYNETFRYIANTYGRARLNDLWANVKRMVLAPPAPGQGQRHGWCL